MAYYRWILAGALMVAPVHAKADEIFAVTPSGTPEAYFDKSLAETIGGLSSFCIDRGWSVVSSTSNVVTCEIRLSMGQSIMGQLLMGNSYSTPPRQFVQFNAGQIGAATRVQASSWIELQMAFGQMRRTDLNTPTAVNSEIGALMAAGGRLPPGTTFPNHVVMGFESDPVPQDGKQGLRVKSVSEGSSAMQAGLQPGDIVFQIAGKRWQDDNSYLDATAKAAASQTYEVVVYRNGTKTKLSFERAFRPAVTALETVAIAAPVPPTADSEKPKDTFIADELAKLADLRERGILNDAEFAGQKARLLSGD